MSLIITKFIIGLIMSITTFLIVRNLVDNNYKYLNLKTLLALIIVSIPIFLFYDTEYNSIITILTFLIAIIVYKRLFKIKLSTSILAMSIVIVLIALVDFIVIPIEMYFIDYETIRDTWYISILSNIIISIFSVLLSKIKILKTKFQKFCLKIDDNSLISVIFFAIVSFWIIIILFNNLSAHLTSLPTYTITSIIIVMLLILYYLYVQECNNYNNLNQEYNTIFKHIQTFEDWIDNEQMYRHELKNNLSIIRNMTKNKKIINKIDEMLNFTIVIDDNDIEDLKNIPKGGLKGLIYYKVALAKNKKVKMIIEASPKATSLLKKLEEKKLRKLCIVLGIYLDNALEAAAISKNKSVTLEIYKSNNNLTFTISNTYKNIIPIKDMKKKGYTTKGKNHGKGLYYVSKVLNKEKWIESSQIFLNDYFIQKICIK